MSIVKSIGCTREIVKHDVASIEQGTRIRALKPEAVTAIASSMAAIGLKTPISVRYYDERPQWAQAGDTVDAVILISGAHRLAAAIALGWQEIECFVDDDGDEIDAQLWEISENLHRADLSVLERDEQVALWMKLHADKLAHVEPVSGGRGNIGGVRAASRDLGIEKEDARRAAKVASLSDEAKQAARDAGLDDNRSALLDAAKHETPREQVKALEERKAKKAENEELRRQTREALPPEIEFNPLAARKFVPSSPVNDSDRYGGLTAEQRVEELEEQVRALESDYAEVVAENRKYRDMRASFEAGGFEKVIADKDEEISVLKTRLYSESDAKATAQKKAKRWKDQAVKLGWTDSRSQADKSSLASENDPFAEEGGDHE